MSTERNYGIDLLKLVLMFMVCLLHTLLQGGILSSGEPGEVGYGVYWGLEVVSYCAVDGFAIVSGYVATGKPKKYGRLVNMWFQAFFYSFILTAILTAAGINSEWLPADMVACALPVTSVKFWYFTAYFCVFLASPILDKFVLSVTEEQARPMFVGAITLFSVAGFLSNGDPFELNAGYSVLWLAVLYCLGGLAKKIRLFESKPTLVLLLLFILSSAATWAPIFLYGNLVMLSYISPTIVLNALLLVALFSRLRLRGTALRHLSPLAFGIYLFQCNQVLYYQVLSGAFAFIAAQDVLVGTGYCLLLAYGIFALGLLIEFIRSKVAALIRIPALSDAIADFACFLAGKIGLLFK